ncbi:MAG: hypothetical protein V1744_04005 [Candidatus Altiarchaeota archaeon]
MSKLYVADIGTLQQWDPQQAEAAFKRNISFTPEIEKVVDRIGDTHGFRLGLNFGGTIKNESSIPTYVAHQGNLRDQKVPPLEFIPPEQIGVEGIRRFMDHTAIVPPEQFRRGQAFVRETFGRLVSKILEIDGGSAALNEMMNMKGKEKPGVEDITQKSLRGGQPGSWGEAEAKEAYQQNMAFSPDVKKMMERIGSIEGLRFDLNFGGNVRGESSVPTFIAYQMNLRDNQVKPLEYVPAEQQASEQSRRVLHNELAVTPKQFEEGQEYVHETMGRLVEGLLMTKNGGKVLEKMIEHNVPNDVKGIGLM